MSGGDQGADRVVGGRYRLEKMLGRGGMGTVWAAVDTLIERRVALKELRAPTGAAEGEFVERALREARNAGRLSHPAVVAVHDVVAPTAEDDAIYIVMEYVPAPTLAEVIDREGPLPAPRVAAMGLGILDGLDAAHVMGVVHRDVKPGNVLIGEGDRVTLTDFGIALAAEDTRLTRSGVVGTHAYLAPECFDTGQAGPAADLWALGATLFHAVAGRAPFDRETTTATLRAILFEEPPAPPCEPRLAEVITGLLTRPVDRRLTSDGARRRLAPIAAQPAARPTPNPVAPADNPWEAQATGFHPHPTPGPVTPPPPPPPTQPTYPATPQPLTAQPPTSQPITGQPGTAAPGPGSPLGPGQPPQAPPPPMGPGPMAPPPMGPAPGGPAPQRNRTPWIIGGAIAAALVLVLAIAAASGGGGGDGGDQTSGSGSGSYDAQTRQNFDDYCSNYPGATKSICDCIWDEVSQKVPYDTYHAFEQQIADDPETPLPSFIMSAISQCS